MGLLKFLGIVEIKLGMFKTELGQLKTKLGLLVNKVVPIETKIGFTGKHSGPIWNPTGPTLNKQIAEWVKARPQTPF